jgi:excisionase family DNA binding protein
VITPSSAEQTVRDSEPMSEAVAPRMTLTVEEAARVLGIGRTLAFEMVRAGQLPVIRLGRRVLVPRPALERLLAGDDPHDPQPPRAA